MDPGRSVENERRHSSDGPGIRPRGECFQETPVEGFGLGPFTPIWICGQEVVDNGPHIDVLPENMPHSRFPIHADLCEDSQAMGSEVLDQSLHQQEAVLFLEVLSIGEFCHTLRILKDMGFFLGLPRTVPANLHKESWAGEDPIVARGRRSRNAPTD